MMNGDGPARDSRITGGAIMNERRGGDEKPVGQLASRALVVPAHLRQQVARERAAGVEAYRQRLADPAPLGTSLVVEDPEEAAVRRDAVTAARRARRERQVALFGDQIPQRFTASLDYDPRRRYPILTDPGVVNVLVLGEITGVGKSHLAWQLAAQRATAGEWVVGWTMPALHRALLEGNGAADEILRDLLECDVALFDEMGSERRTDFLLASLIEVVEHRWAHRLPVYATSNLDPAGLVRHYDERIVSRLVDDAAIIKVEGQSHRSPIRPR
jgi:hypothetical protein